MAKKKKIRFLSMEFHNEDGEIEKASPMKTKNQNLNDELTMPCTCGETRCIEGVLYRCMPDPGGICVWWKSDKTC